MQQYIQQNIIDIKYLLSFVLQKSIAWIYSNINYKLSTDEEKKLLKLIKQRLSGIPLAYITNNQPFYHLDFIVDNNVLIPRPETENIIDIIKGLNCRNIKMLDLGTGSGIIAITLKHLLPKLIVTATDISEQALNIAKKNAKRHQVKINFIRSDWFVNLAKDSKFDLIITNPPYIKENDKHLKNLSDPKQALVANDNGLSAIKKIIKDSPNFLNKNGYLLIEHGYNQQKKILNLLTDFKQVKTFNDLNNQHRNILAKIC